MTSFWGELKRRNVVRVAIAYAVVAWLLIQVAETILPLFGFDDTPARIVVIVLAIGFIPALIFSWAYELTGEGLKKEKDVDRSQSVTNLTGRKLDFAIIGVLAIAVVYFVSEKIFWGGDLAPEEIDKSIAVLPFVNMSGDSDQEYFAVGVTEEILNTLVAIDELQVTGRTSSFTFKDRSDVDLKTIGRMLGVSNILEGSVRKAGNEVRITAQLTTAENGFHLWSETYDRELTDIFKIQEEIATAIGEALQVELGLKVVQSLDGRRTDNPAAYDAYIKGRFWAGKTTGQGWPQAIEHYEEAVRLDPNFALAHAGLADAYVNNANWGGVPARVAHPKAKQAADEAVRLNPTLAEAHAAQALVKLFLEWDWEAADAAFRQALILNLSNAYALHHFGHYLDFIGRPQESLDVFADALALDPLAAFQWTGQAYTLVNMGEFERAGVALDRALELDPALPMRWTVLGMLHDARGEFEEAVSAWERGLSLDTEVPYQRALLGYGYARTGRVNEAKAILETLTSTSQPGVGAMHRAVIFAGLGDFDNAFRMLEQALVDREPWIIGQKIDSGFSLMNHDPRFASILERAGISD